MALSVQSVSYVTLKSTNNSDYSTIIETTSATAAQTATFQVTGGLSTGTVHVWTTNLNSSSASNYFVHAQDITPSNGSFSLTLQLGYLYSLTTTTGQGKGTATSPASASLALPYSDNFESYGTAHLAKYFSDLNGAFETAACAGGRNGTCLRQVITTAPIAWHSGSPTPPLTLMGDPLWTNYQVSTDALLEQAGYVELLGNIGSQVRLAGAAEIGYHLRVANTGAWTLYKEAAPTSSTLQDTTLASGSASFGLNTWHQLSLKLSGGTIQALIDGTTVANVSDTTYSGGQIGLIVSKWQNAQFDNVSVTSLGGTSFDPSAHYKLVNRNSGKALDVSGASTANGAPVVQNTSNGATSQQWSIIVVGGGHYKLLNVNSGKALDVTAKSTADGAAIEQYTDNGGTNQQWSIVKV